MRTLHVVTLHTPTHDFGGPTRVALNLSRGLRARGDQATVLALGDGFPGPLPRRVEGVPVKLFPARHLLPRYEVSGITSPALLARAWAYVRSADLVHVHLMRDLITLPVALMALAAGRPLVLQTHGMIDPTDRTPARIVDALALRTVLRAADALLYLTEAERRGVAAVAGDRVRATAYRLVNGVPEQEARPPGVRRPPTVLFLARVQRVKRPQDFIAAAPAVLASHPGARFVLAGPDTGRMAEGLRQQARELGVDHAMEYAGALTHDEVLRRMRAADVYVLPSVFEPLGVSILEAMSVGLPVVITRTGGLATDVAGAGAGRVIDARDDAAGNGPLVAQAILELLDPAAHARAASAGRQLIRDRFTDDAVVDRLRGIYREVSQRRAAPAARW